MIDRHSSILLSHFVEFFRLYGSTANDQCPIGQKIVRIVAKILAGLRDQSREIQVRVGLEL